MHLPEKIEQARAFVQGHSEVKPQIGVILGTGLGPLAKFIEVDAEIPFGSIPHFGESTVSSHEGKLLLGRLAGKQVVAMQGRLHLYEGYSMEQVTFPVRVMKALGISTLIVSNISGGLNPQLAMGDIMVITDHINLLGTNPLVGRNYDELGPRFPDMCEPYSRDYVGLAKEIALSQGLQLQKGVYACMSGPSLETAAEYRMLRILGSDAIGMSTVPEVIVGVHAGLKILGLSLITDLCLPDHLQPINIPEIMRVAGEAEPKLAALVQEFIKRLQ